MKRSWGIAEQKIVSARQDWKCNICKCVLPSSFELDHVIPLWAGGEDNYQTNAQSLCGTCHSTKTQHEAIQRTRLVRERREAAIQEAAKSLENEPLPTMHTLEEKKKKKPPARTPSPTPKYDPLVDNNPFLKYAFVGSTSRRGWLHADARR